MIRPRRRPRAVVPVSKVRPIPTQTQPIRPARKKKTLQFAIGRSTGLRNVNPTTRARATKYAKAKNLSAPTVAVRKIEKQKPAAERGDVATAKVRSEQRRWKLSASAIPKNAKT